MFAEPADEQPGIDEAAKVCEATGQMTHSRNRGVPKEVLNLLEDTMAFESASQFANRAKCALLGWYTLRDVLAKLGTDIARDGA